MTITKQEGGAFLKEKDLEGVIPWIIQQPCDVISVSGSFYPSSLPFLAYGIWPYAYYLMAPR